MELFKRERSTNFTSEETNLLLSLVKTKKNIIENKKSDAAIWQAKEKAWKEIEKAFNSSSDSVFRDHRHLKLKYEAIKRDTRKKSAIFRAERYKTGGGTSMGPPLTPAEQKVKEMVFEMMSTDGNESEFDSDLVLPNKPKEKRPFDRLTEEKLEIAKIQKEVITEELEQKLIQRKILEKELEHKVVIQELEKQHLLLKIEILKRELENK